MSDMKALVPNADEVKKYDADVKKIAKKVAELDIKTDDDYQKAANFRSSVKKAEKEIKAFFKPSKDTAKLLSQQIKEMEDSFLDRVSEALDAIDKPMLVYTAAKEAERRKIEEENAKKQAKFEEKKLIAEAEGKRTPAAPKLKEVEAAPVADGTSTRKRWKARVIDESLVPREFLIVDEVALNKFATVYHNEKSVPGVEFYEETTLVTRT